MWLANPAKSAKLLNKGWLPALMVIAFAIGLRLAPELLAYPHPIGYDVVNYYIPVVSNLNGHWESISDDFPLYVLILYSVSLATGLSAQAVVVGAAIAIFGLFAFSIFHLGRTMLKLANWECFFLATFVILQLAVLRTAWDLHRDVLALSTMLVIFGLLSARKKWMLRVVFLAVLSCSTIALDRMVGLLLTVSLAAGAVIRRTRELAILAIISSVLFVSMLGPTIMKDDITGASGAGAQAPSSEISAVNYLVLFGVLNGIIAIPAILGFNKSRNVLLGGPFIISTIGVFAWISVPDPSFLVPERWIILFGVFASIYAGYFMIKILRIHKNRAMIASLVISGFAILGFSFVAMPYDSPFILFAVTKNSIENFVPVTMQFNALDVNDNDALLDTIEKINQSTERDSLIVGAKHWRGFMELNLEDERTYKFSDNPRDLGLAHSRLGRSVYLVEPSGGATEFEFHRLEDSGRT